jgi:serine/threonine protein kinase/formylglycine-generating enzyme required for sulfatase activity
MIDLIDSQLGQYHLTEIVRRGGMATVYKAYQPSLDRFVAVKVLPANRDEQFVARFKIEALAIAALQHPNILPIYDFGEQDDLLYLVLQYIDNGVTLADMLGRPMAPIQALHLIGHVLDGLEYAHAHGVVHRDIKPANVLMPTSDWPMLADFGIAKILGDTTGQNLTLTNQIMGTAAYMAPEQAIGRPVDARTDLYAIGVMLYELVTGCVPFDADTPVAVLTKHMYEPPQPPHLLNPDVPGLVESIALRALAKDPAARYQSAADMSAEIGQVATQLEQTDGNGQLTSLYELGVRAFEAGRWDVAVERLGQLVEVSSDYGDAGELLAAAREAWERTRTEARQRLELVRQRRQSTIQPQLGSSSLWESTPASTSASSPASAQMKPVGPAPRPPTGSATLRLPGLGAAAIAPAAGTNDQAPPGAVAQQPDTPTPTGRRWPIPWLIAGLVVAAMAGALILVLNSGQRRPTAQSTPGAAPTAGAVVGVAPTAHAIASPAASAVPEATVAAPTAAPVAAPPPEPAGKLVYQDDFNEGAGKDGLEDQLDGTDFQRGIHSPGVYHLRLLKANDTRWEILPRRAYRDFSMQIELWDNSDSFSGDVAQGVIFRVRDNDHFYAVLIDPRKGQYSVRKQAGDTSTDLIPPRPSRLIKRRADVNLVRVDGQGDTFTIYLNGVALDSFSDDAYGFGMVGMIVANIDAKLPHMHFDNLKIWSSDAAIDAGLPAERHDPHGDMVLIPGGEFIMGSNETRDEPPQMVALPSFYIDRTEVTNAIYRQCVAAKQCTPPGVPASETHPNYASDPSFANFPVIQISWQQAQAFCGWAGKRLPTEAGWEKAASWNTATRAKSVWPWGDVFDPARLNSSESHTGDTTAVGTFPPELNGTFDMGGNVSEWTSSLFKPYPYNEADGREDQQANGDRVFRGGSWAQSQGKARGFYRQPVAPTYIDREIGFRCAMTP